MNKPVGLFVLVVAMCSSVPVRAQEISPEYIVNGVKVLKACGDSKTCENLVKEIMTVNYERRKRCRETADPKDCATAKSTYEFASEVLKEVGAK